IIPADKFFLDNYRGKLVYLDFWASWCGPCKSSFPFMSALQDRYSDRGLVIIAVNVDRDSTEAMHFLEKFPAGFPVVMNPDGNLASEFKVLGMPSSYLIDASGAVVWSHKGFRKGDDEIIEKNIIEALSGDAPHNQTGLLTR
ncbi:MAG: TlpA disulfide reductase family protein, partial [Pseudomonadales bacterium]